jgi:hypothetical protein
MTEISTGNISRMLSSGMLHRLALVRTEVSGEPSASIIRAIRISELQIRLSISSQRV